MTFQKCPASYDIGEFQIPFHSVVCIAYQSHPLVPGKEEIHKILMQLRSLPHILTIKVNKNWIDIIYTVIIQKLKTTVYQIELSPWFGYLNAQQALHCKYCCWLAGLLAVIEEEGTLNIKKSDREYVHSATHK